jgi:Flp pilus assembly protein TadD
MLPDLREAGQPPEARVGVLSLRFDRSFLQPETAAHDRQLYARLRHKQNNEHASASVAKGVAAAKAGNYADAMQQYAYALGIDPRHPDAFVGRGAAYANQVRPPLARTARRD